MSLAVITSDSFPPAIRLKGKDYYSAHTVRVLSSKPLFAEFRVHGTEVYEVTIGLNPVEQKATMKCNCPYYENGMACKHIWAAILKSDEQGFFPASRTMTEVIVDFPETYESLKIPKPGETLPEDEPESPTVSPPSPAAAVGWKETILRAQRKAVALQGVYTQYVNQAENSKKAHFAIDLTKSLQEQKFNIRLMVQDYLKIDTLGALKQGELKQSSIPLFPDEVDRDILVSLLGKTELSTVYSATSTYTRGTSHVSIGSEYAEQLLAKISDHHKLYIIKSSEASPYYARNERLNMMPYKFTPQQWRFRLLLSKFETSYFLIGQLTDGTKIKRPVDLLGTFDQFVFFEDFVALSDAQNFLNWIEVFKKSKEIEIPEEDINSFLEIYFKDPNAPVLELPKEFVFQENDAEKPRVKISFLSLKNTPMMQAHIEFAYADFLVSKMNHSPFIYDIEKKVRIRRDFEFEKSIHEKFLSLEPKNTEQIRKMNSDADGIFSEKNFLLAVEKALSFGWEVVIQNKKVQIGRSFQLNISSGVDWFDVAVNFNFENTSYALPALLQNLRSGQKLILLGDGSYGILPEEWLKKFGPIAAMAEETETGLRMNKVQALFMSAGLEDGDNIITDNKFSSLKDLIEDLSHLKPLDATPEFHGQLRDYQKQGLSWLTLLTKHQLGGILADDMGLGKTIQVLALLAAANKRNEKPSEKPAKKGAKKAVAVKIEEKVVRKPTLIVAPKSLVFNWIKESEKFTPDFKILNFTGVNRHEALPDFDKYDIILTTYHSLRMDIDKLQEKQFGFFILDEAHYIKNPDSQAALACRLIKADQKAALTGTPIENSLTDLFSILSVVTPGLITKQQSQRWAMENNSESLRVLSQALRPFILRRTKAQVLKDLPEKSEQILYCELSPLERKKYTELKAHYWNHLNEKFQEKGVARSKIEILEALLRLRQAACHQGLLDSKMRDHASTKFELLLEQIDTALKDGHKALIFSQFTTLLELFKKHLRQKEIAFEYLDGQTKDRQERVENFQNNPDVKVFLLSLKAGGVGLNLTAADYVFILDPWWNPAAESQAIDRTHRIGQNKKVFAYKIIAKDTVEEKILDLQKAKQKMANAVISDEESLLKKLKLEDLRALFM